MRRQTPPPTRRPNVSGNGSRPIIWRPAGFANRPKLRAVLRRALPPLLICLLAFGAFQWKIHQKMVDFGVYRTAAVRALNAEPLYRDSDGHYQFKYLPVFAMTTIPFGMMDEDTAKMVWFAVSVGALVLLLRWSAHVVPARRRGLPVLIGLTFLFLGKFFIHELLLGQVNLVFGLLIVAAIGALQSELPAVAGALFGAAVCVKPYGVLFAPWVLVSEDRRATLTFAIAGMIAILAPAALYGFGGNAALLRDWWQTVTSTTAPNLLDADNISFAAMWAKWLGPGRGASVLATLTGLASLGLVVEAWRRRADVDEPDCLETAALLLLIPLLSPQGWDYVLLLATPAVMLLLDRLPELVRGWRIAIWASFAIMGLTIFDLLGKRLYAEFMNLSIVTLCALGLLAALAHLRRAKLA